MSKQKSVEFQIWESDAIRIMEKECGKQGAELAKRLFAMGEDNINFGLVLIGLFLVFKPEEEIFKAFAVAIFMMKKKCPTECDVVIAALNEMISSKLDKKLIRK